MARVLFTLWDGGGNVAPPLTVARALVERGHRVRVLADAVLEPDVRATGAEHRPWVTAPQRRDPSPMAAVVKDWEPRTPLGVFARIRDDLLIGPSAAYAADVIAELDRERADVLVTEALMFGPLIAAEATGTPAVSLASNLLSMVGTGAPPTGSGFPEARGRAGRVRDALGTRMLARLFDTGLATLNATRARHRLAPLTRTFDQLGRVDRLLILASRAFEYPSFVPAPNVRFVGPRLDDPAWAAPFTPPPGDGPLVLASLSSTYMRQRDAIQRIATALGELPVRGLVTTGPAVDPADVAAPRNVTVVRSAPHTKVLPHAAVVVTHAGHSTVAKALAAGVPIVAMPFGRDQPDNAQRIAAAGAGLRIAPSSAPATIAAAVRQILADASYREGAARLAAAIAADLAEDRAVAEIEGVLARAATPIAA